MLFLCSGILASSSDRQPWWRKALISSDTAASMMLNRVGSSIVFPLQGNVYPAGYYNVTINIGQPPRPYFLDVDTGSDLTWLQCDAPCRQCIEAPHPLYKPSNQLVPCKDPICTSLRGDQDCEDPDQCDYEVEYADGGSSLGVLVKDYFLLNSTNGKRLNPLLALGCGYDQLEGRSSHPLDGILGLGKGISSIPSQLSSQGLVKNVIGHCLSGRGGGFLFFGDDIYDSSRISWTPMSRDYIKYYSPGLAEMIFDGKSTGIRNLPVVFDSGSSYSYLNSQAYQGLLSSLRKILAGKPLTEADNEDTTLPICWKGKRPFKSVRDVRKYFKTFTLSFNSGGRFKTHFEFPPEAYLIISYKGNACLGVLNGTQVGLRDLNVIGDISMLDRMVIYNNEKQAIGWAPANCDRIPKFKTNIF